MKSKVLHRAGFTLVELIVVLVVLAILAAIIIPSMVGWIEKAREKEALVPCRTCVEAADTILLEKYAVDRYSATLTLKDDGADVLALAGVGGSFFSEFDVVESELRHLYYFDATGTWYVSYCSYGGCSACGHSETYTVSRTPPSGVVTTTTQYKSDQMVKNVFGEFKDFDAGSIKRFNSDALSNPNSKLSALWSQLSAETQNFLSDRIWCLNKDNNTDTTNTSWRLYFTAETGVKPGDTGVTLYKTCLLDDGTLRGYQIWTGATINAQGQIGSFGHKSVGDNDWVYDVYVG